MESLFQGKVSVPGYADPLQPPASCPQGSESLIEPVFLRCLEVTGEDSSLMLQLLQDKGS